MRPPICCICNKEFFDFDNKKSGLIYFKKTHADCELIKQANKMGIPEHPPNAEWFCEKHYKKAKEYSKLTLDEALKKLGN